MADQGLVHHLHRVVAGGVTAGHHQAVVRQAPGQGPAGLPQLLAGGQAASVFRAFARPHELEQHAASLLLFGGGQGGETGIRMAGQGTLHAADGRVGGMGDQRSLAQAPELGEGKLQQREMARLGGHILEDPLHHAGFKGHGLRGGGLFDRLPQLRVIHRAEFHVAFPYTFLLEELGERAVGEGVAEKIRPHREQQPGSQARRRPADSGAAGARGGESRDERIQKRPPQALIRAEAVELLKLIGDQQQLILQRVVPHLGQHIR